MIFETHFDEEATRRLHEKNIALIKDNRNAQFRKGMLMTIVSMIVGIGIVVFVRSYLGYLLVLVGFGMVIYYGVTFYQYRARAKEYWSKIEVELEQQRAHPVSTNEFNNIYFKCTDYIGETCIVWKDFETYKVIDDKLYLFPKEESPFVFEESEMGKENFEAVLKLVASKIEL